MKLSLNKPEKKESDHVRFFCRRLAIAFWFVGQCRLSNHITVDHGLSRNKNAFHVVLLRFRHRILAVTLLCGLLLPVLNLFDKPLAFATVWQKQRLTIPSGVPLSGKGKSDQLNSKDRMNHQASMEFNEGPSAATSRKVGPARISCKTCQQDNLAIGFSFRNRSSTKETSRQQWHACMFLDLSYSWFDCYSIKSCSKG